MTNKTVIVAFCTAMAVATTASGIRATAAEFRSGTGSPEASASVGVTDQVIVHYRLKMGAKLTVTSPMLAASLVHDAANLRGYMARQLHTTGLGSQVWRMDRAMSIAQANELARDIAANDPDIEYVEPDRILRAQLSPNDTYFSNGTQWDLYQSIAGINVQAAWDHATGAGVTVAVVDTGYRSHADLAANMVAGYDFIADAANAADGNGRDPSALDAGDFVAAGVCALYPGGRNSSWHGTHVAGTVAAVGNNGTGVVGVAFGAKVQPVRVLGRCGGYTSDIADGIVWAAGGSVSGVAANPNPARVINLSLGGLGPCGPTFGAAVQAARNRGAVVIVAAGNNAADVSNSAPANCAGVIAVASVSSSGARAPDSNYGSRVSLAAPGVGIFSTYNTGVTTPATDTYAYMSGTSMATPHVSGAAALMLSANPSLRVDDVEWKLMQSARGFPVACTGCGSGLLDASNAVNAVLGYAPSSVPLFSVTLLDSDSSGGGTWQISNLRNAPVLLSEMTILGSNATAYVSTSSCAVGGWLAAGGTCAVMTSGAASCSGGTYWLRATNSAGTATGSSPVVIPYQSCGA